MNLTPLHVWIGNRIGSSAEDYTRQDLEHYQLAQLQWVIQYARDHSRFYRELFSGAPTLLSSLAEMEDFPFTTAEDLRADPNRFACVSQEEIKRIVTLPTSGTTGESKRVYFTAADQELTVDFFKVGMSTLVEEGDRVLILLPGERPGSVGDLLKLGLERLGCIPTLYGPVDDEEKLFKAIIDHDINVIVGAPVHLLRLARLDDADWVLPKNQIHKVLSSTDTLPNSIRSSLQALWGCEVFDHWGMTETGLGGAVECEAHQGMHLREADLYIEIIDPVSGKELPEGETGEVVITTLTRAAMPLIRYRTGDLSRILMDTCACGSFIKRLDRITQRVGDGIQFSSGMITLNDLDELLLDIPQVLDFSASIHQQQEISALSLSIRTLNGSISEIEELVLDMLLQLPALQAEMESGKLKVQISAMEKPVASTLKGMHKRRIRFL
jgi:phenylacetate-CoA ligase